jgi:hypothetical protein
MFKMLSGRLPWESDSSDDEALLLVQFNSDKQIRKWIHEVNMERKKFGEFHHLLKQLQKDELKFIEYFRMSIKQFDQLFILYFYNTRHVVFNFQYRYEQRTCLSKPARCTSRHIAQKYSQIKYSATRSNVAKNKT